MSNRTLPLNDELHQYIQKVSVKESSVLSSLRARTMLLEHRNMQIAPEQGQFMSLLVSLLNARKIIEVGVFTGYSTLCMAEALSKDGNIVACDVSKEWTDIAREYWDQAAVADKIDLRLAPALETLSDLISHGQSNTFDMVFIDADKTSYLSYYNQSIELVRPGGLIMIDNTLWNGAVVDKNDYTEDAVAIREFNQFLYDDSRVEVSLVPIGDGLTLARKI